MTAQLTIRVDGSTLELITNVCFEGMVGRLVWALVTPIHRRTIPYLLRRSVARRDHPFVVRFQRHVANPIARRLTRILPGQAVLETTGRRTGLTRRTPVGGRLCGTTFWLVSEFGGRSDYVRNIRADPNVRVRWRGRWYCGMATIVDTDDPRRRLEDLPRLNGFVVRFVGTDVLSIRVDLDTMGCNNS